MTSTQQYRNIDEVVEKATSIHGGVEKITEGQWGYVIHDALEGWPKQVLRPTAQELTKVRNKSIVMVSLQLLGVDFLTSVRYCCLQRDFSTQEDVHACVFRAIQEGVLP